MRIIDRFKLIKDHGIILFKHIKDYGIIIEFIILVILNYFYFLYLNESNQDFWEHVWLKINTISTTDIIAFLTICIFAIGLAYDIGYVTASRMKYHLLKNNLGFRDRMIKSSVLFFLAFFLPLVIFSLSKLYLSNIISFSSDVREIILLFVLNIVSVFILGFLNEKFHKDTKLYDNERKGKISIANSQSIEFSELYQTTDVDYRFKDSKGNEFIIPIGKVCKIEYSREEHD